MAHEGWSPTHSGTHSSLKVDLEFVLLRDARVLRVFVYVCVRVQVTTCIAYVHLCPFFISIYLRSFACVRVCMCVRLSVENISVFLCIYIIYSFFFFFNLYL